MKFAHFAHVWGKPNMTPHQRYAQLWRELELADALETRAPAQFRKLVFMTGGAFTPVAGAFRERHATQCVEKPFDILSETSRRLHFLLRR